MVLSRLHHNNTATATTTSPTGGRTVIALPSVRLGDSFVRIAIYNVGLKISYFVFLFKLASIFPTCVPCVLPLSLILLLCVWMGAAGIR